MTAYQINDILEEPFWLEDTQMKTVSIIIPVHYVLEIGSQIGNEDQRPITAGRLARCLLYSYRNAPRHCPVHAGTE